MAHDLNILRTKLRGVRAQIPYVPRTLALVWTAARNWAVAWAVLLIAQGLLPVATVYLTRGLVDGLVAAAEAGGAWHAVRPVVLLAILLAAVLLLLEVLRGAAAWVRGVQAELLKDHISGLI